MVWMPLPRNSSTVSSSGSAPQSIRVIARERDDIETAIGDQRSHAWRQPPVASAMRLQCPAFGIDSLDLGEADIGLGESPPHQLAIRRHRLMDRADIAAAQQHGYFAQFLFSFWAVSNDRPDSHSNSA